MANIIVALLLIRLIKWLINFYVQHNLFLCGVVVRVGT